MVTAAQAKAISERYLKAVELVASGKVPRLYGGREGDYVVTNGRRHRLPGQPGLRRVHLPGLPVPLLQARHPLQAHAGGRAGR